VDAVPQRRSGRARKGRSGPAPEAGAHAAARGGAPEGPLGVRHLGQTLAPFERVLVFSHMNPDPDTVGAGAALALILRTVLGKTVQVCYRGLIGRAENRQLIRVLNLDIVHAKAVDQSRFQAVILVDCQPDYGYVPGVDNLPVAAVIDHHPWSEASAGVPHADVRPHYGSTSTILTEYVQEAGIEPDLSVATALFYGLKTDTQDLSRRTSAVDVAAYEWLLPRIDRPALGRIENPPLSRDYYSKFVTAVGRAVTYRSLVVTELGRMPYPDMVAEIADRLIRITDIEWSVCFGWHDGRVYLSVRTVHPTMDAGALVKTALLDEGMGGGHDTMAAGRVLLTTDTEQEYLRTVERLWLRFLVALDEDPQAAKRLVSEPSLDLRILPGVSA
jgi:nanoRNase/pAp phosphatase (c-di-AMP/oligoRNAs hydrolase)